jgi:transcriptional regulator with XRE-family HTH domain
MTGFGEQVRALMAERGMSLRALARAVSYDPSYLSKVLSGRKPATPYLAASLDEALGAEGKLKDAVASVFDGSLSEDRRDRLDWAARRPRSMDLAAVDALADVLASQRRTEDCLGSEAMLRPVGAQMTVIEDLVREAHGPVRPRLVHVAGQWAQFLGWLLANTGSQAEAEARLRQALGWAVESGDVNLISEVLSFQGHAAWIAGQPGPLIGLSQAARRDVGAYPGQLAIASAQEAQGHAMTGDDRDVGRLLDEADELAARARERPGDAPPWLYYHSPGFFDLQRGLAYRYLVGDPAYRGRAASALAAGYSQLTPGDQASEWGAEFLVYLADVHARGGDLEQAAVTALRAAAAARQMDSARLLRMLRRLRAGLAARWPGDARVGELADALR